MELVQDQIRHLKDVITGYLMIAHYGQQGDSQFYDMRDIDKSPAMKAAEKELKELEQKLIKLKRIQIIKKIFLFQKNQLMK